MKIPTWTAPKVVILSTPGFGPARDYAGTISSWAERVYSSPGAPRLTVWRAHECEQCREAVQSDES